MKTGSSAAETLAVAVDMLTAAGCERPARDAELLLADTIGIDPSELTADLAQRVSPSVASRTMERVKRRAAREPLAYLLGRWGFRRIELVVDARVLVPDHRASPLVDIAVQLPSSARVHDVGTGSGAIALAIKSERPDLTVSGSDLSTAAIEVARANAARLSIDVEFTVVRGLPSQHYDLVVANLPYADDGLREVDLLPEDALYQPHVAVFAGPDGLEEIRALVASTPPGTSLALAHAPTQTEIVRELLLDPNTYLDPEGNERVTAGLVP